MNSRAFTGFLATRLRRAGGIAVLAFALVLLTRCSLDRGTDSSGAPSLLSLGIRAQLPPSFNLFASNLAIEQVRLALVRPPSDTIARVTRPMSLDSGSVRFSIAVALNSSAESLLAVLEYQTAGGTTLFSGEVAVEARTGSSTPNVPVVPLTYSGPGGNIASLSITPLDDTVFAQDSVLYQISAIDSNQQPVPSFYVSWSTSDSRVPINALGVVRAPNISAVVNVTALTPNGTAAQTSLTVIGSGLSILPDSVEKLPLGTQQFQLTGPPGPYTWSVNAVDGGNATFGTVDTGGFYTAPATVPSPSKFPLCARVTAAPQIEACAIVVINPIPTAGADVVVFNDLNMLDDGAFALDSLDNDKLVRNLVGFTTTGSRANGNTVMFQNGHGSICGSTCLTTSLTVMSGIIRAAGMLPVDDSSNLITSIPINVKVLILWTPSVAYTRNEINLFKQFSGEGGRIVFVGENSGFYGTGIPIENQFLRDMGAVMTNIGQAIDCGRLIEPATSLRQHQVTTGMTGVAMGCASVITLGPNDFALWYDTTNTQVLAGVAKVDLTPLPAPPAGQGAPAPVAPARPTTDPLGHSTP